VQKSFAFVRDVLTPVAVLLIGGLVAYDHLAGREPAAGPAVNGRAVGRAFAPTMAPRFGDAWLAAADALEKGKTVAEAQATLQATWQESRAKAFAAVVAPEFRKVMPEGSEPTDPARRAEVIKLWRDFASGLKGGR